MRHIKEILRLKFECGLSHEKIARACQLSKGVVTKYAQLASAAGLNWPQIQHLDDAQIMQALLPPRPQEPARLALPDFHLIHQELRRKGVTLQLLWEEYQAAHPGQAYQYTQFSVLYRRWRDRLKRSMRQVHRAGEKLFVDYSGKTVPVTDPDTGEISQAQVFVAVLGASSYTYAEATASQRLPDWIGAHIRAFEYLGCLPELIIPDNLKSGVTAACYYEPEINRTYASLAAHYGVAILPARPYKPKDKPKAEAGVLLVQRWILARLRNRKFFNLLELNGAIRELLVHLNNRPFQKNRSECRHSLFDAIDRPAMKPLPANSFEYQEWAVCRVNYDYHIEIGRHYYSVPHNLVKEEVDVRLTVNMVEVFYRGKRVASHPRSAQAGQASTLVEHMPRAHQKHRQWTPGGLLTWGAGIGAATGRVVERLLEDQPHPEKGYRACLGLTRLCRRYGQGRLEAACARALTIGAPTHKSVKSILEAGLDQHAELFSSEAPLPAHENVRGPDYYH
jgi:transposase